MHLKFEYKTLANTYVFGVPYATAICTHLQTLNILSKGFMCFLVPVFTTLGRPRLNGVRSVSVICMHSYANVSVL